MSYPWFRLYAEFVHDPKVQMLSEAMQRRFVMLMCLRCSSVLVTLDESELAFQLRLSDQDLSETKKLFIAKGFIDEDWNIANWKKRQFLSDSSTERVARHRERKKRNVTATCNVTESPCNVIDTEANTDINTDTEITQHLDITSMSLTEPARACLLMRKAGCIQTNPNHPDLVAAINEGITPEVLGITVSEALAASPPKCKPFAWAIATARGRHKHSPLVGVQYGDYNGNKFTQCRNVSAFERVQANIEKARYNRQQPNSSTIEGATIRVTR